jgi:GNAT superfamily N-acetyltransferase
MSFQPPNSRGGKSSNQITFYETKKMNSDQSKDLAFTVRIDKITMEETIPLRHSVLWPNMPPSHVCLPEDATGTHYGAFLPLRETPVAVISLFLEDLPLLRDRHDTEINFKSADSNSTIISGDEDGYRPAAQQRAVRFRKFACEREFQGKGIGTQLLVHILSRARTELDATTVWCDARATACGWYTKRGLVPFGPTFYKGPEEYIRMRIDF